MSGRCPSERRAKNWRGGGEGRNKRLQGQFRTPALGQRRTYVNRLNHAQNDVQRDAKSDLHLLVLMYALRVRHDRLQITRGPYKRLVSEKPEYTADEREN